jgi:peroxiredoxin
MFSLALGSAGQGETRITPTLDDKSPTKVYVPRDLDESYIELKKMLPPQLLHTMMTKSENDMIEYHHGLGTWLRNNWGLWAGSRLAQYFRQLGIHHPDDMSGIILTSFWRQLHGQEIRLTEQVNYYKEHWRKSAEKERAITPVPESALNRSLLTYRGQTIRLSDFKGKVVVLAWLDESCGFTDKGCRLTSSLVEFKSAFTAKPVEVIGIVGPSRSRRLKEYVRKYRINFPLVLSDDRFSYDVSSYDDFGYMSFPQIFVISSESRVIKRIRGFDPRKDPVLLRETVEEALK